MIEKRYIRSVMIDWKRVPLDSYTFQIESIRSIKRFDFSENITIFSGENQSGKSTLLEAIAVAYGFNPEGGTLNYRFETFNDVSDLHKGITISKGYGRPAFGYFFRAESFYNVSSMAEEYEMMYGGKFLHDQSHGESFMSFLKNYSGNGLYILDEPEAALSPRKQIDLLLFLEQRASTGSQIIMATHSPILLRANNAEIWSFDGSIHRCEYEETDTYRIMKAFLENRDNALAEIEEEEKNIETAEIVFRDVDLSDMTFVKKKEIGPDDELMDLVNSLL